MPKDQTLLHKSLALFTELGMRWDIARSLIYLGEAAAAAGDSREARRFFLESLPLAMEARAIPLALDALIGLAFLQAQAGEAELALKSSIYVLHHTASTQEAKARAEHLRAQLESQLALQLIEAVQARAQVQSLDALVAELLAADLEEAKHLNETVDHRCVGLCIETRPDWCDEEQVKLMNPARLISRYYAGSHVLGASRLHVTRGIGCAGPRLRIACPPEISSVQLVRDD